MTTCSGLGRASQASLIVGENNIKVGEGALKTKVVKRYDDSASLFYVLSGTAVLRLHVTFTVNPIHTKPCPLSF